MEAMRICVAGIHHDARAHHCDCKHPVSAHACLCVLCLDLDRAGMNRVHPLNRSLLQGTRTSQDKAITCAGARSCEGSHARSCAAAYLHTFCHPHSYTTKHQTPNTRTSTDTEQTAANLDHERKQPADEGLSHCLSLHISFSLQCTHARVRVGVCVLMAYFVQVAAHWEQKQHRTKKRPSRSQ